MGADAVLHFRTYEESTTMQKLPFFQPGLRSGILASAVVGFLLTSGNAVAGSTPEQKCQDAAMNAAIKYYASALKAVSACEAARASGDLLPTDNCRPSAGPGSVTDIGTATALLDARTKLGDTINKKCTGVTISTLTFGKPCDSVASTNDLTNCIADDAHGKDVDDLVNVVYGPVFSSEANSCRASTINAAAKFVQNRMKARRKCAKLVVSGKAKGPCPDAKTNAKFDKDVTKLKDSITGSCSTTTLQNVSPGFPCDLFAGATYVRTVSGANSITLPSRYARCIAAAASGSGDLASETANPLGESGPFSYGVAAGDATDTAFMAWTRTTNAVDPVTLQVATDAAFASIVDTVTPLSADVAADNTVHAEATGLTASTAYYYRFTQGTATSRTGRIKTAPTAASTAPFTFAFTGDANAYFKPYSVLEQITEADPDAWFFIGDTIYGDDSRSGSGVAQVRSDYHNKYKENRDDRATRDLMANVGMYTIWDDHEVTNDFWGTDPAIQTQMQAGNQGFRDYMPLRVNGGDPMQLYRSFKWGDVAEFFLIDARSYRSSQADHTETACVPGVCSVTTSTDCVYDADCLIGETCLKGTCNETGDPCNVQLDCDVIQLGQTCDQNQGMTSPSATCQAEIDNPTRTYLGATQLAWLENGLLNSTAKFKFVLNGPLLSAITFVPYDRWEGYSVERAAFLDFVDTNSIKNVIFLSTDIHAAIYDTGIDGGSIKEFVAGAVGMDPIARELPADLISLLDSLPLVFPEMAFYDLDRFNVATLSVSQTQVSITWQDGSGQVLKTVTVPAE